MTSKTPEQKIQGRIDSLILCFAMTSFGLISMGVSIPSFYIFNFASSALATWFVVSLGVSETFGILAIVLFLSSSIVRNRLITAVKDSFRSN